MEKVGTGCNNTERVSNAWLCISLFLGLEAERAFNMSWPLKSNLPSIFKENPNQKCRLKQQEWEPYPPHCHLCKQVSATASPECQIQLQTAASSASVWISAGAASPAARLGMMLQLLGSKLPFCLARGNNSAVDLMV